jgi:hypothetical protein
MYIYYNNKTLYTYTYNPITQYKPKPLKPYNNIHITLQHFNNLTLPNTGPPLSLGRHCSAHCG